MSALSMRGSIKYKTMSKLDTFYNCNIVAQSLNLFYLHESPTILHHCTKIGENQARHL